MYVLQTRLIVKVLTTALLLLVTEATSVDKLPSSYLVSYGDPDAQVSVTEYFSFQCPHCVRLFNTEFKELKAKFIDTRQICLTFHPVPMDLLTLQAMDCLSHLNDAQKRAFLEIMLNEIEGEDSDVALALMKRAMELFSKPLPQLNERTYIETTKTFQDAFQFLTLNEAVEALPTAEINGKLFPNDPPSISFLESALDYSLRDLKQEKLYEN